MARTMRWTVGLSLGLMLCSPVVAQQTTSAAGLQVDSDHDGLSDALEQELLVQFMPSFMIGQHDCSIRPAEFETGISMPKVAADNGTIYGQAFPAKTPNDHTTMAELHFYHLWRKDCGGHGHALDTEHVAVLIQASDAHTGTTNWKAVYWYAGAHENTVCDVSQIARASTLHAEDHGAKIWISPGKHASYLNGTLCATGCGADRCEAMTELVPAKLVNLGEPGFPMNGSAFLSSNEWPLQAKMTTSNFPANSIARLDRLPDTDIAWFHPGRHPVQGIIRNSNSTGQALAARGSNSVTAISVAGGSTGDALSGASSSTGDALQKSYKHTRHALGTAVRHVGKALRAPDGRDDAQPR